MNFKKIYGMFWVAWCGDVGLCPELKGRYVEPNDKAAIL